ncbi:MAG: hypothetical protein AAFX99_20770, partial [Myxococcota bacterium]
LHPKGPRGEGCCTWAVGAAELGSTADTGSTAGSCGAEETTTAFGCGSAGRTTSEGGTDADVDASGGRAV